MNERHWVPAVLVLAGIIMIIAGFVFSGNGWAPMGARYDMPCDLDEFHESGAAEEAPSPAAAQTVPASPSASIYGAQSTGE